MQPERSGLARRGFRHPPRRLGPMAHHVEREITTTCRRERAFDFVADFSTTQEWDPGIQAAKRLDDRPIGVGSRFELVSRFGSTEQTIVYEIAAYDRATSVTLVGE